MKHSLFVIAFLASITVFAAPAVQKLEISCSFDRSRDKHLEAHVYQEAEKTPYAVVEIVRYVQKTRQVLETHTLLYSSKNFSLYWNYENQKDQLKLSAFGDDMGGMSSWEVKKKKYDLTCMIEELD